MKPVIFSSKLTPGERRVYKAATILFIAVFFAFMWPIYPIFNRVRPLILGMPASLFYLVFLLAVAFLSILALYRWEDRHGKLEEPPEPAEPAIDGGLHRGDEPPGPSGADSGRN